MSNSYNYQWVMFIISTMGTLVGFPSSIRIFGRFPYRNAALGRSSNPAEADFIAKGGYAALLRDLEAPKAA